MTGVPAVEPDGRPLGLGLVGCGSFGLFVLEAIADLPGAGLVALADTDRGRAESVAARHGGTVLAGVADLLAEPAVDVVVVATPPATHGQIALAAVGAGKHVFCEKPLATDLDQAREAEAAVERSGTALAVDYVMRWNPLYWLLQRLQDLRRGDDTRLLGSLRRFAFENLAADERLPPDHWFWDRRASGGIFVEHGVHFFDAAAWLIGSEPLAVQGLQVERPEGLVDTVSATAVHPGGAIASYCHAFAHPDGAEYQVALLDWGFAHGLLWGWIPVDLELDVWTDAEGAGLIGRLVGEPRSALAVPGFRRTGSERIEIEVAEMNGPAGRRWRGRGEEREVTRRVRLKATLGGEAAKARVYRECVRAGAADLLAAVRQARPPLVGAREASASLATALAAQAAAESGRTVGIEGR